jgi:arabinofuranosyltransferase
MIDEASLADRPVMTAVQPVDDHARLLSAALIAVFAMVLVRTAWLSDDAYINFRTIDNLLHGYGLRWNIAERVETFTDPLWIFLITPLVAVTREFYYTVIVLCMALSTAAVILITRRVAAGTTAAMVGLILMISSKAFVDFSTSGLEGPLMHCLLVGFFIAYWRPDSDGAARVRALALTAALIVLTRLDAVLLVTPALLVAITRHGWRRSIRPAAIGLGLILAWESFSVVYYGFLFPNTAYAKLGGGVPRAELAFQGLLYLLDSIASDPVTLAVIATAVASTFASDRRRDWPVAAGLVLTVAYVVWVAGDFMSGRFLAAPFVCAVMLLVRRTDWAVLPGAAAAAALIAVLAAVSTHQASLLTDGRMRHDFTDRDGIVDERRVYYPFTGLMSVERQDGRLTHPWAQHAREVLSSGVRVTTYIADGFFGFTLGPSVHSIDPFALGDPLLARLPSMADWRPGHFGRRIPNGYEETLASGTNQIAEPSLAEFYERLQIVTRGPIWRWQRAREIWRFNTGAYRSLIDGSSYGLRHVPAADLAVRKAEGAAADADVVRVQEGGIAVDFERELTGPVEVSLDANDDYRIVYSRTGRDVGEQLIRARWPNTDGTRGLALYQLAPDGAPTFDQIRIYQYRGYGPFSIGHLIARP